MKYGYMPSIFETNPFSEIEFAKKHFDFIEITLPLELDKYDQEYISKIKRNLENFEVIGHLHWEIDLSQNNTNQVRKVFEQIDIFKKIGAEKITIHPSTNKFQKLEEIKQNNLLNFQKIVNYCRKNKINLLIENMNRPPFNNSSGIKYLLKNIPFLGFTLDVGHANRFSKSELNKFLKFNKKIKHIHLHYNFGKLDHLFFNNKIKLKKIIKKIKSAHYNGSITLESFSILKNKKSISLDGNGNERRNLLLKELKLLKEITR